MRDHRRRDTLIAVLAVALLVVSGTAYVLSEVSRVEQQGEEIRSLARQAQENSRRALEDNPLR